MFNGWCGSPVYGQAVVATYRDRYAFRENITDVIVQHFLTEQKVFIQCPHQWCLLGL
jgi:intraflagellar transport protein 122